MSSSKRTELVYEIGFAISQWQDAFETFDETVGGIYQLTSAERRCISFVSHGAQTASAIAKAVVLTPAAVTSLIDRLEARGFVRRVLEPKDRRKVMVEPAQKTKELNETAYMPIFEAGSKLLSKYTLEEMRLIKRFIVEVTVMQQEQTEVFIAENPKREK
jgi:DNA-binding MarR family transcriptional regulator